ncbi:tetraspanin family protein [Flavobacterium pectinovorum]|uniref:Uncharacterized protein n=1 Tax=Flavobacterium pectinovorum TaxID=29533 RepID=A0A502ELY1_9FLAO|nr:tetraspanin family protein [Flavobacterium pectinovorum]TPG38738.1 hypothetical protein EAH81_14730 [Flavobacterium pectinovorum]
MDNKTKFFKNTLLLQFIPVFLLGIFILSNFREQKTLRIRDFHPYEFNYGQLVPVLIFGIGLLLSLLSLLIKQKETEQDETEVLKIKRRQNFWKFAFYNNVFLVAGIAIFSAGVYSKEPLVINQSILFYSLIISRSVLVIIISLATAAFLLAVGINWKTNKALAVTILIFSFFIIGVSFVGEYAFVDKFITASEDFNSAKNEKKPSVNEEVEEDYTESEEGEESYEGEDEDESEVIEKEPLEIDKSRLVTSFETVMENWFGEKITYRDEFTYTRISVSNSLQQGDDGNFYLLNYMVNLKDRPKELTAAFENYKEIFYSTVSEEKYQSAGFDQVVDGLLLTYEDVGTDREKLNNIYRVMEMDAADETEPNIGGYFPGLEKYCSSYTLRKLRLFKGFSQYNSDIVWFYSFWARRNKDGSADEIAFILKDIKEHYK